MIRGGAGLGKKGFFMTGGRGGKPKSAGNIDTKNRGGCLRNISSPDLTSILFQMEVM